MVVSALYVLFPFLVCAYSLNDILLPFEKISALCANYIEYGIVYICYGEVKGKPAWSKKIALFGSHGEDSKHLVIYTSAEDLFVQINLRVIVLLVLNYK